MKIKSIVLIFLLIVLLLIPNFVYADDDEITAESIFGPADIFVHHGMEGASNVDISKPLKALKVVARILTTVGTGILVICTSVMGIKYMISSPNEKAHLKEQLFGLLAASFVVCGSYTIWSIVVSLMTVF